MALVVAALLVQLLGLVVSAWMSAAVVLPALATWSRWLAWVQLGTTAGYPLLFFLFLHRLGAYLGRRDISRRAKRVPVLLFLLLLTIVLGEVWVDGLQPRLLQEHDGALAFRLGMVGLVLVGMVLGLWSYVAYLRLLHRARRACAEAA